MSMTQVIKYTKVDRQITDLNPGTFYSRES